MDIFYKICEYQLHYNEVFYPNSGNKMSGNNKSKKSCVTIVGFIVLIIGFLLLVLPGPGIIVIAIGLAILALEYEWAKKYFDKLEGLIKKLFKK